MELPDLWPHVHKLFNSKHPLLDRIACSRMLEETKNGSYVDPREQVVVRQEMLS